jgi:hypothetical protein
MVPLLPQSFHGSNQIELGQKVALGRRIARVVSSAVDNSVMTRAMRLSVRKPVLERSLVVAALTVLSACGAGAQATSAARSPGASNTPGASSTTASPAPRPGAGSGALASKPTGSATSAAFLPRLPEITLDPKQPLRPLPALKVENIGLHVGGGPNDADTKAPFQHAIAERFGAFEDCYRKNEDPAKGGRFGIDLHIPRAGGHPQIEQPRTAMRGPEFRACLSTAFESVEFDKPKRGPTTISYSLHFTVGEEP